MQFGKKILHCTILQKRPHFFRPSASELRGVFLVVCGIVALVYYYSWWLEAGRLRSFWLAAGFGMALCYGTTQLLANWLLYLATHHRSPAPKPTTFSTTVDVFVTACGEEPALVQRCLAAACAMRGKPRVWLLDDGRDPNLERMAHQLGAGYLTRTDRKDAKAGNLNAALRQTDGHIVAIFDIDHVPAANFLERTLAHFEDETVGFVQVMPTFSNGEMSWVARAAAETSLEFYNPTSMGMDALHSVTKMGSNCLIRRSALERIGGYQPGLAEDLATSLTLHAAGWRSAYVAEPLAPGLAPPDLTAWFTQQFKWSRGVFEELLTRMPRLWMHLSWAQRLCYLVRTTKYWIGMVISLHMMMTLFVLIQPQLALKISYQEYLIHLLPLAAIDVTIRSLALRKWHSPGSEAASLWRAAVLIFITWPVYTAAWFMALLRVPLQFRLTPKGSSGGIHPLRLLPQLLVSLASVSLVAMELMRGEFGSYYLVVLFALALSIPFLLLPLANGASKILQHLRCTLQTETNRE